MTNQECLSLSMQMLLHCFVIHDMETLWSRYELPCVYESVLEMTKTWCKGLKWVQGQV